jgi:superfamily II DNA or RNA helicase
MSKSGPTLSAAVRLDHLAHVRTRHLPNSVSPVHYNDADKPPEDLFDLIIIDEAHHAPAETWRAVLEHFKDARALAPTT